MLPMDVAFVILIVICLVVAIFVGVAIMFGSYGNAGCKQLVRQMFSLQVPLSNLKISPLEFICDIVA